MRQQKGDTPFKAQLTYRHNESQRVILIRLDVTKAKVLFI